MNEKILQETSAYLSENFLTLEQLAQKTHLSCERIQELKMAECIPGPSYTVLPQTTIKTFVFGETTLFQPDTQKDFYHPSVIEWINRAQEAAKHHSMNQLGTFIRENFQKEFGEALLDLGGFDFGYKDCFFDPRTLNVPQVIKKAGESWNHVLKGTYGVCVRNPINTRAILRKEIAVNRLELYLQQNHPQLRDAWEEFDQVVSSFSPHERHLTSRHRLTVATFAKLGKTSGHVCC